MRNIRALMLALALGGLIPGCGFEHPLSGWPDEDLNTWLLGVWEHRGEKGEVFRATVTPASPARYRVTVQRPRTAGKPAGVFQFEAYASRVGRAVFLNLCCIEAPGEIEPGKFLFIHSQVLDQNHVRIRVPDIGLDAGASGFALRRELRRKWKDGSIFPDRGSDWARVSEVYWSDSDAPQPFQPLRFPEGPPPVEP